jgi:hypothetical protein
MLASMNNSEPHQLSNCHLLKKSSYFHFFPIQQYQILRATQFPQVEIGFFLRKGKKREVKIKIGKRIKQKQELVIM